MQLDDFMFYLPKEDGMGPAFGRVAAIDVDELWLWVAPMKNVQIRLVRGLICQMNLISTCDDYYRYLIFLPSFNQTH